MTTEDPATTRDWFERGYMAAFADSLADKKPIPISDDLLDRAWERQPDGGAIVGHVLSLTAKQRGALLSAFIVSKSGGGQFEVALRVKWPPGTRVCKKSGSSWQGRVVGYYSTSLTPEGYAVESEREPGSVQIYPRSALEVVTDGR